MFRRHSGNSFEEYNIFIVIIILLLVLLSLNIQNLLVLLSAVDLGGQNYIAALVFGTVYLGYFFYLKTKPTRGVLATSIGTVLLLFLRSRTAILAVIPLFINIIINNLGKIQRMVVLVTVSVVFLYFSSDLYTRQIWKAVF